MGVQLFDSNGNSCFTDSNGNSTWTDSLGNFLTCAAASAPVDSIDIIYDPVDLEAPHGHHLRTR